MTPCCNHLGRCSYALCTRARISLAVDNLLARIASFILFTGIDKNADLLASHRKTYPNFIFLEQNIPPFKGLRDNVFDFVITFVFGLVIDLTLTFSSMSNEYIGTHSSTQRVEFTMPNMKNYNQPKTMEVKPAINWVANSSNKSE